MDKYRIDHRPGYGTWWIQKRVLWFFWKDYKCYSNATRANRALKLLNRGY